MGTGIMGCIPLSFCFGNWPWWDAWKEKECKREFTEQAPEGFFDFYSEELREVDTRSGKDSATYYVIKPERILPGFKDFYLEFIELIGEKSDSEERDGRYRFNADYDAVVASGDLNRFIAFFDDRQGGNGPVIFSYFAPMYVIIDKNLLVYRGSYKAMLEEWTTLTHMERMLRAAMKNPLANVMRFGMST